MIRLLSILVLAVGISADPQFGLGLPKAVPASPAAAGSVPFLDDALEWTMKISDLVTLTRSALQEMGDIAVADNPDVGAKIVAKLGEQIAKAAKILADFTAKSATPAGRRRRRDTKGDGDKAYNDVGGVLVESNDKTQPEKSQLSPEAQEKMDNRHDKAIMDCGADVCKSHAEKRRLLKEAKAAKKAKA